MESVKYGYDIVFWGPLTSMSENSVMKFIFGWPYEFLIHPRVIYPPTIFANQDVS
jgi:hypothetical protein